MSAPGQWQYGIDLTAFNDLIEAVWVDIVLPQKPNMANIGTSFWLSAQIPKFVQVGVAETRNSNGFQGWRGFYASQYDLTDPSQPYSVRVHNFKIEPFAYGAAITLRIGKKRDGSMGADLLPRYRFPPAPVSFPTRERVLTSPSVMLEAFDQIPSNIWNLSNYYLSMPWLRTVKGLRRVKKWPHARGVIHHNKPPSYLGMRVLKSQSWYGLRSDKVYAVRMGHLGDLPDPRNRLW